MGDGTGRVPDIRPAAAPQLATLTQAYWTRQPACATRRPLGGKVRIWQLANRTTVVRADMSEVGNLAANSVFRWFHTIAIVGAFEDFPL